MATTGTTHHLGPAGHPGGYRRFLGTGIGSGLLGGLCCVGSAIAAGAGVGGLSFFTAWMRHYQAYFILASIAVMAAWLLHLIHLNGAGRGFAVAARGIWRHAAAMGAVYALTLLAAMAATRLAG
jgi:hypothetical protein